MLLKSGTKTKEVAKNPFVSLAVAVVRRALQDLSITGIRNSKFIRQDAYDFLVNRMWRRGQVWADVLVGVVDKSSILSAVSRRCRREIDGNITPMRKK